MGPKGSISTVPEQNTHTPVNPAMIAKEAEFGANLLSLPPSFSINLGISYWVFDRKLRIASNK